MERSIFSYLFKYTQTAELCPKENYLTEMLAWMVDSLPQFGCDYVRFLCNYLNDTYPLTDSLFSVCCKSQVSVKSGDGYIDMVIATNAGIGFICEHKVDSSTGDGKLDKYRKSIDEVKKRFQLNSNADSNFKIVLVTKVDMKIEPDCPQDKEPDIGIRWNDVYSYYQKRKDDYPDDEKRWVNQFLMYLREEQLCEPFNFANYDESYYKGIMKELAKEKWNILCPGIDHSEMIYSYEPLYNGKSYKRDGRIGVEMSSKWLPGIFAGIIWTYGITAHHLPPILDDSPDFVVFLECCGGHPHEKEYATLYQENVEKAKIWYHNLKILTNNNSNGFHMQLGIDNSPWRLIVLRKPLSEVIKDADTREEQKVRIKETIQTAINMLLQAEKGANIP